jgi:hypothetical protein
MRTGNTDSESPLENSLMGGRDIPAGCKKNKSHGEYPVEMSGSIM